MWLCEKIALWGNVIKSLHVLWLHALYYLEKLLEYFTTWVRRLHIIHAFYCISYTEAGVTNWCLDSSNSERYDNPLDQNRVYTSIYH